MATIARALCLPLAAALLALAAPAPAAGDAYLPPSGKVFTGLTGSSSADGFTREVGKHPAVFGFFTSWNRPSGPIFQSAEAARSRPMLHISTAEGYGIAEKISPGGIARGEGDRYLAGLNRSIADYGGITYVRLMAEMNQTNNAYCAFNRNGSSRGASHSTANFIRAWRRAVLIVRGGPLERVNTRLRELGLPEVRGLEDGEQLARPRVALLWVPQVAGTPDTRANRAAAYWPGAAYVDWVGTDFYSKFPNFAGLERFYREFAGKPFAFGEWAMWERSDPRFVTELFGFMRSRPRVRMHLYNQGADPNGPFRLRRYPAARRAIRQQLESPRQLEYAPELAPR